VSPELRGCSADAADGDSQREQAEDDSDKGDVFDGACLRPTDCDDNPQDPEEEHDEDRQTNETEHALSIRSARPSGLAVHRRCCVLN
jgi:hypothetical protein